MRNVRSVEVVKWGMRVTVGLLDDKRGRGCFRECGWWVKDEMVWVGWG